jgi:hypothetical protein
MCSSTDTILSARTKSYAPPNLREPALISVEPLIVETLEQIIQIGIQ